MTAPELIWQKSSFSGGGGNNCVEVAAVDGDSIAIRESTEPERVVRTTRRALGALIEKVKASGFEGS